MKIAYRIQILDEAVYIFHIAQIPLEKILIQKFSLQLWVNGRVDWLFDLGMATGLTEGKLNSNLLKSA